MKCDVENAEICEAGVWEINAKKSKCLIPNYNILLAQICNPCLILH
jgi:hypothetical protein